MSPEDTHTLVRPPPTDRQNVFFDCIVPSSMKDIKQKQIIQMEIQVFLEGQNFATKYVAMLVGVIMDHCFWTEVSVCHSSLCGLALVISVL